VEEIMAESSRSTPSDAAEGPEQDTQGADDTPEVYALNREGDKWSLNRRSFIAAAGGVAAAGAAGCSTKEVVIYQQQAGGGWETIVADRGTSIPDGAICVCNTVRDSQMTPGQPTNPAPPTPRATPTPYPTGPDPHSTPRPPSCSCHAIVTYWYPN
jgi:hypothetical protein